MLTGALLCACYRALVRQPIATGTRQREQGIPSLAPSRSSLLWPHRRQGGAAAAPAARGGQAVRCAAGGLPPAPVPGAAARPGGGLRPGRARGRRARRRRGAGGLPAHHRLSGRAVVLCSACPAEATRAARPPSARLPQLRRCAYACLAWISTGPLILSEHDRQVAAAHVRVPDDRVAAAYVSLAWAAVVAALLGRREAALCVQASPASVLGVTPVPCCFLGLRTCVLLQRGLLASAGALWVPAHPSKKRVDSGDVVGL